MKKVAYLFILSLTLIFIPTLNFDTINANEIPKPIVIKEYEEDVTGDGIKENINLYGTLLASDSNFYKDIYVVIKSQHNQKWKIQFDGGYHPEIDILDFTHNGVNDLLFKRKTGEDEDSYVYALHTVQGSEVNKVNLPNQQVSGQFIDGFQAELSLAPNSEPVILDLNNKAEEYSHLDIFDNEGHLLKSKSLIINPISSMEPILISKSKGYGLKSYQPINGAHDEDELGVIETTWYHENNKWIILQTDWQSTDD